MEATYWQKQTDKPLFEDLIWSRPETKQGAGKLLIVGGSSHGFAEVAKSYQLALKADAGSVKVLMPDSVQKTVKAFLPECEFAPSTPSGSFANSSLAMLVDFSNWADGVLLAGELGRNSETAILLEKFATKITKPTVITKDSIDYFYKNAELLLKNQNVCLVASLGQLQKIVSGAGYRKPVTLGMDLLRLVETLHEFSGMYPAQTVTNHLDQIVVASGGKISTTRGQNNDELWQLGSAVAANVWWLQNQTKPFEALTTAVYGGQGET